MSELLTLDPGVAVLPLRTPTLPPASRTNTMVVGTQCLVVIEPATPHEEEQSRLLAYLDARAEAGAHVEAILLTHHHPDHTGFAEGLRNRTGAPLMAHAETARRIAPTVDRQLADDEILELDDGYAIRPIFTPGHAPGHLVYVETRTNIAHVGDMVAGEGTILIDPDDSGDMLAYLDSLRRLIDLDLGRLVPAHGPVLEEPKAVFEHYIAHRLGRERKVVDAIGTDWTEVDDVLAGAYADTPKMLWPLARRSLEAHVQKLVTEGRVGRDGTTLRRLDA